MGKRKSDAVPIGLVVHVLIDESGSMSSMKKSTIAGFNSFIRTLGTAFTPTTVSLSTFGNYRVKDVFEQIPVFEVPELTDENYYPSGGTPLNASIRHAISKLSAINAQQRVVVIMTDGVDDMGVNAGVAEQIKSLQDAGWLFLYVATGASAVRRAADYNVPKRATLAYGIGPEEIVATLEAAAQSVLRFGATNDAEAAAFTADERKKAKKGGGDD